MDGPWRRQHSLFVMDQDVPCLVRFAHEVKYRMILGNVEVEVDLGTAQVCVWRHRVPHATLQQLGVSHYKLAGPYRLGFDHFAQAPMVAAGRRSQFVDLDSVRWQVRGWICCMRRIADQVEPGCLPLCVGAELHIPGSSANIEAI